MTHVAHNLAKCVSLVEGMGRKFNLAIILFKNLVNELERICTLGRAREGVETGKPILVAVQVIDVLLRKWFPVTKFQNAKPILGSRKSLRATPISVDTDEEGQEN